MLGKDIIERKFFIKDIMSEPYKNFELLVFETFTTFYRILKQGNMFSGKGIRIYVKTIEEITFLGKIMDETELCKDNDIEMVMSSELFISALDNVLNEINDNRHIIIVTDSNFNIHDLLKDEKKVNWINTKPAYAEINITYDNYVKILSEIPRIYVQQGIRFFKFNWDFRTFERMTLGELHKFEFWLNHIIGWQLSTTKNKLKIYRTSFIHELFITEDLKFYYNKQHYDEDPDDFILDSTQPNELQADFVRFKKYDDIDQHKIYFGWNAVAPNWTFMNYYHNEQIMGNVNEVPIITMIIMKWMARYNVV